ncbi:hypothetical protein ACDX78_14335 [Virgibacillus oceani]
MTKLKRLAHSNDGIVNINAPLLDSEDSTIMSEIYRVFSKEVREGNAHHFLCKVDRNKSLQDAYQEFIYGRKDLKYWGELTGEDTKSIH